MEEDAPSNPHATPAENARFAAFAAALERDGFSPITRACYASDWWTVSEHARRASGRRFRLGGFTADDFRLQRAELTAGGTSPATLNRRLSFLRRYAAFAARSEPALASQASAFASLPFQSVERRTTKALTHGEEQRIRAAADADGIRSAAIIALILGTGLRASELAELTRGDVFGPKSAPTALRIRGPRAKTVMLGPFARPRIAQLLAAERGSAAAALFRTKGDVPLGEEGVAGVVERVARQADVEATPRTLRHTFAVRYLSEHRDDVEGLAHALGQTSLAAARAFREEAARAGPSIQVRPWSDLQELTPQPGVRRRSYPGARVRLERELLAPGTEIAREASAVERLTVVLSGRVTLSVGEMRIEAGPGDVAHVPSGTACDLIVGETQPALLLHAEPTPRRSSRGR
jgi:integrase/recombinase XerD